MNVDSEQPRTYVVGPGEVSGNISLGEFLASLRVSANLTKPKVAEALDISLEYLRLLEKGRRSPALGLATKMFDFYGVQYSRNDSEVLVGNVTIKFISRIKEARQKDQVSDSTRDELIGQIVKLLVITDDDTLRKIYSQLKV